MSSGIWFVTAYGLGMALGADLPIMDTAIDAAIMGGSAFASDTAHSMLKWVPSPMTSAVLTGTMYAAAQKAYRGDSNYLVNVGAGAANDYVVEIWATSLASTPSS